MEINVDVVAKLYPVYARMEHEEGRIFYPDNDDYEPIIEFFCRNIIARHNDDDYQGDTLVLFRDDTGKYGYLEFGWGSCSGCDALQSCETLKEISDLMQSLYDGIKWFDTVQEAQKFFETHDWEGDWTYKKRKPFIEECKEALRGSPKENEDAPN